MSVITCVLDKKDLSPSEEWGVDQQLISKLKEQYKKDRKGKQGGLQSRVHHMVFLVFVSQSTSLLPW